MTRPHIPCHMVWSAAAITLDRRERRHIQSTTRRRRARCKTIVLRRVRVVGTHARDMPKMTTILHKQQTKKTIIFSTRTAPSIGFPPKRRRVRSIFGWSPGGGAWGIPLGCGRCHRTSSIVWPRRCAAPCMWTIRGQVYGSCSRAAPATYRSQRCGRL